MNQDLASIIAFLLRSSKNQIAIVRHGSAAKADQDFDRQLSMKGVLQGRCTREHISGQPQPVGLVVSSTAPRAARTVTQEGWPQPILLNQLYIPSTDSEVGQALDEAFNRLGYAPLSTYANEPEVAKALELWAHMAAKAIEAEVAKNSFDGLVVVGCHAIMSQALACIIAKATDPNANVDQALNIMLGEGEVLTVSFDGLDRVVVNHLDSHALGHHRQQTAG